MSIEVTARHIDVGEEWQTYARGKAEALMAEFPKTEHVHVILDYFRHRFVAEVVAQSKKHVRVEAAETTDNMRMSIDSAFEKVEKQLRKVMDKVHDHKVVMKHAEAQRTRGETA
jgi:ribosomal subunit interface protein